MKKKYLLDKHKIKMYVGDRFTYCSMRYSAYIGQIQEHNDDDKLTIVWESTQIGDHVQEILPWNKNWHQFAEIIESSGQRMFSFT